MPKYELKQLNEMSDQRLQELLREEQESLRKMRFQATGGDFKSVHMIGEGRRLVARVLTVLSTRALKQSSTKVGAEVDKQ